MRYSAISVLLLTGLARAAAPTAAQKLLGAAEVEPTVFNPAFDEFVKETLEAFHVPGLSVAVIDGGKISSKGYGFARLPETKATADTQYFTGSTTKAFTAAFAAMLVHDDVKYPDLKWTTPIADYLRNDFVLDDEYVTRHITLEDVLSHRTGLPRHDLIYGIEGDTPVSVVQRIRHLPFTAAPRTRYQYCNIMFGVATAFIERVTGKPLETLLHDTIWMPLGMASTSFSLPEDRERLARGYYWNPPSDIGTLHSTGGGYIPEAYANILPISGAGATVSTVNDYALWAKALLSASNSHKAVNISSPITPSLFRDLTHGRTITDLAGAEGDLAPPLYGLGWVVARALNQTVVWHEGGLTGFGADLILFPESNYAVVTMANTMVTSNLVGSLVLSLLIVEKFVGRKGNAEAFDHAQEELIMLADSLAGRRRVHDREPKDPKGMHNPIDDAVATLPLPFQLHRFAGVYTHPGYGQLNLTVADTSSDKTLHVSLGQRTWPIKMELEHATGTMFTPKAFWGHGLGLVEPEDIVWEKQGVFSGEIGTRAVFELDSSGESVDLLGIELEEEMVIAARERGDRHWREGMIWFERV